jgi:hypothetical protein
MNIKVTEKFKLDKNSFESTMEQQACTLHAARSLTWLFTASLF